MNSKSAFYFLQICICTYNNCEGLKTTLAALQRQLPAIERWGVIVIDNNSTDSTRAVCTELQYSYDLQYYFEPEAGLLSARIRAIKESYCEWIVFVDDDNEPHDNFVKEGVLYITKNPLIAGFNGKNILSFEEEVDTTVQNLVCFANGLSNCNQEKKVPLLYGAGMFLKKIKIQNSHYCTEQFLMDREKNSLVSGGDNELSIRVAAQGGGLWFNPKCIMTHHIDKRRTKLLYLVKLHLQLARVEATLDAMNTDLCFGDWKSSWHCKLRISKNHILYSIWKLLCLRKSPKSLCLEISEAIGTAYGFTEYVRHKDLRNSTFGYIRKNM